ncbi:MAG: hypothetical protein ACYDAG_05680 [Chloroflexota bacterium]
MTRLSGALIARLERAGRIGATDVASTASVADATINKYRNEQCGRRYPRCGRHASLKEHHRSEDLAILERTGRIRCLREHVAFELVPAVILHGRKKPPLRYVADSVYEEACGLDAGGMPCWRQVVEDVKSPSTRKTHAYRDRLHLMKSVYDIEIKEV